MLTLPNVTTTDKYADCQLGPVATCQQIRYVVANKPVLAQIMPQGRDGTELSWGDALLITPESNVITRCQGMRFKSAVSGAPAQVIAQLIEPRDPVPTSGNPFSATLSAGGGVTPGTSSVQIQKDGTLVGTEPILDLITGLGMKIVAADDAANTRVTLELDQTAIADTILAVAAASVDIQNIPQTYADLELSAYVRGDAGATAIAIAARFNGDAGANYDYQFGLFGGAGFVASENYAVTSIRCGRGAGATAPANRFGANKLWIPYYANVANDKGLVSLAGSIEGTAAGGAIIELNGGAWRSIVAVNRVTVFSISGGNLVGGCRFTLRGQAGA